MPCLSGACRELIFTSPLSAVKDTVENRLGNTC